MIRFHSLYGPYQQCPHKEPQRLADKQKQYGRHRFCAIEAQGYHQDISYKWNPGNQRKPDTIFVHLLFLFLKGFAFDLKPFLKPLPSAQTPHVIGNDAAKPIARRSDDKAIYNASELKGTTVAASRLPRNNPSRPQFSRPNIKNQVSEQP